MTTESSQPSHSFASDFAALSSHYGRLLAEHGDSPQAVQYRDTLSHERRFEVLAQAGDLRTARVLDFGCGTGRLLEYLRRQHAFAGQYTGYDLNADMVETGRKKFPDARFEARDVLASGVPDEFDFVFINGVFNNLIGDNWGFLTSALRVLFARTRTALAFNALSTYVDYFDAGLYYAEPEAVFRFCKTELSPCVTLRHDYQVKPGTRPFEFTVYVHRVDVPPCGQQVFR